MRFGETLGFGVLGAVLFFSVTAQALPQCQNHYSRIRGKDVRFCVQRSRPELPAEIGEPVVYFFHGITGNADSWKGNGYAEALDILGPEENMPPFTVVSFDTSATSFFSDRNEEKAGSRAYETWFVREFMPYIEKTYQVCAERRCRGTGGLSMGGYGALKTAIKYKELFSFAGVNSAAVSPFNVWNGLPEWNEYFGRHPVGPWRGHALLQEIRGVFRNKEQYDRNDPVLLLEAIKNEEEAPRLYLDVGGKDYFGFQEGYFRLTKVLDERRWAYDSFFDPHGGHDIVQDRRWWLIRFFRDQVLRSAL